MPAGDNSSSVQWTDADKTCLLKERQLNKMKSKKMQLTEVTCCVKNKKKVTHSCPNHKHHWFVSSIVTYWRYSHLGHDIKGRLGCVAKFDDISWQGNLCLFYLRACSWTVFLLAIYQTLALPFKRELPRPPPPPPPPRTSSRKNQMLAWWWTDTNWLL